MQTLEPPKAERAKILITVKTYPLLSSKHTETVCTAGLREEGKLIRKHGARKNKIASILREKYLHQLPKKRDIYLFLGTNKYWHIRRSSNPFMIVGIFYPPVTRTK